MEWIADGKVWSDAEVAGLLWPYNTLFWIADMMEGNLFVFTYKDLQEMPGVIFDRLRYIQSKRVELRGPERS
jgi:hypothetical protein